MQHKLVHARFRVVLAVSLADMAGVYRLPDKVSFWRITMDASVKAKKKLSGIRADG
jgi:hypothetical protein